MPGMGLDGRVLGWVDMTLNIAKYSKTAGYISTSADNDRSLGDFEL